MKQLVTKIKSWFKPKKKFKEIEQIEQTDSVDPADSIDAARYALDHLHINSPKETQAEKMRELAEKKRNNKPFYKDDKAKEWEQ